MQAKPRVTLKDVAKEANVNFTLVSKFLTGNPQARMTNETKERIKKAIKKLGYLPSSVAQTLRCGKSRTIGLLIGNLTNAYYAHIANFALRRLRDCGYQLLISLSENDSDEEAIQSLLARDVDGIIYAGTGTPDLQKISVPVAVNDRHLKGACEVNLDLENSLSEALKAAEGKIAGLFLENSLWSRHFCKVAARAGTDVSVSILPFDAERRKEALRIICKNRPDTIFVSGWHTVQTLTKIIGNMRENYSPRIFAHANCTGSFLKNRNIAGAVYSSTTDLISTTCRALISQIENPLPTPPKLKICTRFLPSGTEEFKSVAGKDFGLT